MTVRIAVFIDSQNVRYRARNAFHQGDDPGTYGQISPGRAGKMLALERSSQTRPRGHPELTEVRAYRGMPRRGTSAYDAAQRQLAAWRKDGVVPVTWPMGMKQGRPVEKGIDVSLALDLFAGAIDQMFDVAILFSMDRDFEPLIQKIRDPRRGLPVVIEIASWWAPPRQSFQITMDQDVHCHRLTLADYETVRDRRNYSAPRRGGRRRQR